MATFVRGLATAVAVFAVICAGCTAQDGAGEKHVAEIVAEDNARHPQGASDSILCKQAADQRPPYSRFRIRETNPATLEKDLRALMQKSDEVVLVGLILRNASVLSPSGEDALSYTDARVLRVWKGSHKVGDLLTMGSPKGLVHCGPDVNEFTGTQFGPVPRSMFYTRSHGYAPAGPFVLFLQWDKSGEIEGLRLAGENGVQGMFDIRPSDTNDATSVYSSCSAASFDSIACNSDLARTRGKWEPPWCRDPRIDQENVAKCNAALDASEVGVVAYGVKQDPVREKYNGMPIASFLKKVQATADSLGYTPRSIASK